MASAAIDFSLEPDLGWGHLILGLAPTLKAALSALPETASRAEGAYLFCGSMGHTNWGVKERECFLRAALAEFVSMEDALSRDLVKAGMPSRAIKIRECPEPELHMVHHLRNLEFHLQTSSLKSSPAKVFVGEDSFETSIWFVQDLSADDVISLRNVQLDLQRGHCTHADIERLVDWFNQGQRRIGVREIIMRAVIAFSKRIVAAYSL